MSEISVEQVVLSTEMERKVAVASVRLGDLLIRGITVWQGRGGRLRVFFPSSKVGYGWEDNIALPEELRAEVEAEVLVAYREKKRSEAAKASASPSPTPTRETRGAHDDVR